MSKLELKDLIKRYYTKELENNPEKTVYDLFQWKKVDVKIVDYKEGKVLFERKGLEFPDHYSQNACDIIASRYFRRAGVNNEYGYEVSMREVAHRMVKFWVEAAKDEGLIDEEEGKIVYDELVYMLLAQMWAPNSPQWFNTGLKLAYGIDVPSDGNFYYDPEQKKAVPSKDQYTRTSGSACFIISIRDSLLGYKSLSEQLVAETKLFKQGAGTGTNFSPIRAAGERLSGGGTSSGVMSFLKVFDRNAGAIKSGGITRRAAKLVTLNADHPEILDYITWKMKEEEKVRALVKMGYSPDFNGEAYATVSGQNSNNSVRFSNAFMKKILGEDPDTSWTLKGRVDSGVNKTIDVNEIWEAFNKAAWSCGDPAPQFDDIANEWHTCPAGEDGEAWAPHNRINASNPCSEFFFLDDTACNLASINIAKFYNPDTLKFDTKGLLHCVSFIQIALEATIHWGQFPTEDIARKSHMFRPTGLGIANTAALHMMMGHPYDSDEARTIAATLMGIITGQSYLTSSLMAKTVGPFEKFEINKKYMMEVIRNHARVAGALNTPYERLTYNPLKVNHEILKKEGYSDVGETLKRIWKDAVNYGEKFGYRNAQVTVIAPTGTIALAMDCGSTSTEPFFAHVIYKKLAGGGYMVLVNPVIEIALKKLGYTEDQIKDIVDYIMQKDEQGNIIDGKIEGAPHLKEEHLPVFDTANKCGTGKRYISPMGHVLMTAALTPLISGAISKTVNLPNEATIEDFKKVHINAYKLGVKAITLYRDGCKASQPLNTVKGHEDKEIKLEDLKYYDLLKKAKEFEYRIKHPVRNRPEGIRISKTHEAQIDGLKIFVTVSAYNDGKIAEIYMSADREGTILKGLLDSLSKTISKMIQYNIPIEDVAKSLLGQKYEPHGLVIGHPYIKQVDSISDFVARIIFLELGDFRYCQIQPKPGEFTTISEMINGVKIANTIVATDDYPTTEPKPKYELTNKTRVYGKTCTNCGSTRMHKNGTCYVCEDCGETTGCS